MFPFAHCKSPTLCILNKGITVRHPWAVNDRNVLRGRRYVGITWYSYSSNYLMARLCIMERY